MTSHARNMLTVMAIGDNVAHKRWTVRVWRVLQVFFVVFYVLGLASAALGLVQVSQSGDWEYLWKDGELFFRGGLVFALFMTSGTLFGLGSGRELANTYAAIRQAAIQGDERIAPLAAHQPSPFDTEFSPTAMSTIVPLQGPYDGQYMRLVMSLMVPLMAFTTLICAAATLTVFWIDTLGWTTPIVSSDPTTDAIFRAIFGCFGVVSLGATAGCVWIISMLVGRIRRAHTGMTIPINDSGLTWVELTGKRHYLPWGEAQLFCVVADDGGKRLPPLSFHALLGQSARLVWMTPSPDDTNRWQAHVQLCRLIVTATGLRLRDLSSVSGKLANVARGIVAQDHDSLAEMLAQDAISALPGASFERVRVLFQRQSRLLVALLVPYFLLTLAGLIGSILQHFGIG
jgi:hypothetical protein